MNTIFWLAIVFGVISFLFIIWQIADFLKCKNNFESFLYRPKIWMYPTFIVCLVVAVTVRG